MRSSLEFPAADLSAFPRRTRASAPAGAVLLAAALCTAPTAAAAQAPDFDAARDEVVEILREMIRIDSSSPPGNETAVARWIQRRLEGEGIASRIYEKEPGRGNLVARLEGNGSERPVVLMGHIDVVGVERDAWSVDPFAGVVQDGYVWGRGAQDDKGGTATNLMAFILLKRTGVELDRDVIFMANAGEEGMAHLGIEHMIEEHVDEIDAEFALNEGGSIREVDGRVRTVMVATTEKVGARVTLTARGTSGHGSRPRPDNPIVHLARAVGKFGAWQPPMRLNATTREYFRRMAAIADPETAFLYRNLENPDLTELVQEQLRLRDLTANSMLRTSISPTIIEGGFRRNVIPAEATATFDIRALPDEDVGWLHDEIRRVIDDPAIEVKPLGSGRPVSPPMPTDSEMFLALERAQAAVFPDAITVPTMLTGATDSAQLRAAGVLVYGIGTTTDEATGSRAHGNDERTPVRGLGQTVEFLYRVLVDVAGS